MPVPLTRSSSQSVVFLAASVPWWTVRSLALATFSDRVGPAPFDSSGAAPLPFEPPSSGAVSFFLPGIAALVYAGWEFAGKSLALREASSVTGSGLPVYPVKMFIPIAGACLLLQAFAEIVRAVICIRTGTWPARAHDVEEADVEQLKSIVQGGDLEAMKK